MNFWGVSGGGEKYFIEQPSIDDTHLGISEVQSIITNIKSKAGVEKFTKAELDKLQYFDRGIDSILSTNSKERESLAHEIEITNFFSGSEGVQIKTQNDIDKIKKLFGILGKNISSSNNDSNDKDIEGIYTKMNKKGEVFIKMNKEGEVFIYNKAHEGNMLPGGIPGTVKKLDENDGYFKSSDYTKLNFTDQRIQESSALNIGVTERLDTQIKRVNSEMKYIKTSELFKKIKDIGLKPVNLKQSSSIDSIPGKYAYIKKVDNWNDLAMELTNIEKQSPGLLKKIKNGEVLSETERKLINTSLRESKIPDSIKKRLLSVDKTNKNSAQKEFGENAKALRDLLGKDINELSYGELMEHKKQLNDLKEKLHTEKVTSTLSRLESETLLEEAIAKIDEKVKEVNKKLDDPKTERAALNNADNNEKATRETTLTALKKKFENRTQVREFQQKLKQFFADNNMPDYLGSTDVDGIIGRRTATAVLEAGKKLNEGRTTAFNTEQIIGSIGKTSIDENVKQEWKMLADFKTRLEEDYFDNKVKRKELQEILNRYAKEAGFAKLNPDGIIGSKTNKAIQKVFTYLHEKKSSLDASKMIAELQKSKTTTG